MFGAVFAWRMVLVAPLPVITTTEVMAGSWLVSVMAYTESGDKLRF